MSTKAFGRVLLPVGIAATLAAACGGCSSSRSSAADGGDGGASADQSGCPTGSEACPCYEDETCDTGLSCVSNVCVALGTAGSGGVQGAEAGSGGSTGGGEATTGGAADAGGAAGDSGGGVTAGVAGVGALVGGASLDADEFYRVVIAMIG